jgi:phage-related protein
MNTKQRPLFWIGNSYKELVALPDEIIDIFGFALGLAQRGEKHDAAKPLKGFGGAGVLEVVAGDEGGTYRAVYTVTFPEAVFALHCFQKKSKRGIATSTETLKVIRARLKTAEKAVKEIRRGKKDC